MIFGKEYYDSIWGSVHRHDYCSYWVERILKQHGKCRVLDCGAGCGYLVKLLRERGCCAWGIDISDYAVANSCAAGFVLKASVTDIPFQDDYFDVVVSNGLWSYVPESDVAKGRDEIWRVGKNQIHNIDHDKTDFMEAYATWKPLSWWDEQLAAPKVLVSCPTHESKEYAHAEWSAMAQSIDYPNYEIFVVDNSPTPDCYNRWKDKIPMEHIKTEGEQCHRMAESMEVARNKFLSNGFSYWWNVEIDVIPAPSMLKTLLKFGKGADWTAHCYPSRGAKEETCSGIGCSLWSRRLISDFSFRGSGDHLGRCVDAYFWDWVRPQNKYLTREFWGHVPIKHLAEQNG